MLFPYRKITTPKGESGAFTIDRTRFDKVLRKIAYALYFDAYKTPWDKRLMIFSRQLLYQDFTQDAAINLISEFESKLPEVKQQGENAQVFHSSILKTGKLNEDSLIRMVFYEGFTVWAMVELGSIDFAV